LVVDRFLAGSTSISGRAATDGDGGYWKFALNSEKAAAIDSLAAFTVP